MAAITTVAGASGAWETGAIWSSGTVPTSADNVTVGNTRYTVSAQTGAAGVDLVFTATGHTFVNGDEVVLGGTGYNSAPMIMGRVYFVVSAATNTFKLSLTSGGAAIQCTFASHGGTVNVAKRYVLTLDSVVASAREVLSLTFETGVEFLVSTAVNTQIQVRNNWTVKPGARLNCDLSAYPSITTKWKLGANATTGQYGLLIDAGSNYHVVRGAPHKRRANLISSLTANSTTSFMVDDATGWQVGERLVLSATQPRNNVATIKVSTITIATITSGSGTTATITFTGTGSGGNTTPNSHQSGGHVGNFSSNFTVESVNKTVYAQRSFFNIERGNASAANSYAYARGTTDNLRKIFVEDVLFDSMGSAYNRTSLSASFAGDVFDFTIGGLNNNAFYDHTGGLAQWGGQTPFSMPSVGNVFVQLTISTGHFMGMEHYTANDVWSGFGSFWCLGNNAASFSTGCVVEVDDFVISGGNLCMSPAAGAQSVKVRNSEFYCFDTAVYGFGAGTEVIDTDLSKFQSGVSTYPTLNRPAGNGVAKFTRCMLDANTLWLTSGASTAPDYSSTVFESYNADADNQRIYANRSAGVRPAWERDNSVVQNSLSSIKGYYAGATPLKLEQQVLTASGVPTTVVGYMRKNAAYGSSNLPYVEMDGLGTTVSATMSNVDDTWEKFTINFTQTSGGDGQVTLRMVNTCAGTSGNCWFSGLTYMPFVTRARHYGYTFDEPNPLRVVNPAVTDTEATAAAYTGVTINSATPQITVGAGTANTFRKVYDYIQAWACLNIDKAVLFTSTDGNNFAVPLTCKVSWPSMGNDGMLSGGWLLLGTPGVVTHKLSGTKVDFTAAGTYDMSGCTFNGSVEFVNSSGDAVTVSIPSGFTPVNTGPSITLSAPVISTTIAAQVSLAGAEIRVYDLDNSPAGSLGTELAGTESCPGSTFSFSVAAGNNVWVQIMLAGYKEYGQQLTGPAASTTYTFALTRETDA